MNQGGQDTSDLCLGRHAGSVVVGPRFLYVGAEDESLLGMGASVDVRHQGKLLGLVDAGLQTNPHTHRPRLHGLPQPFPDGEGKADTP